MTKAHLHICKTTPVCTSMSTTSVWNILPCDCCCPVIVAATKPTSLWAVKTFLIHWTILVTLFIGYHVSYPPWWASKSKIYQRVKYTKDIASYQSSECTLSHLCANWTVNWIYTLLDYLNNLMDLCLSIVSFKDPTMLHSILS